MATLVLTISALLLYSSSKHFPYSIPEKPNIPAYLRASLGGCMAMVGIAILNQSMDLITAFMVVLVVLMTLIPLLIFSIALYPNSWKAWTAAILLIAIIDLARHAS